MSQCIGNPINPRKAAPHSQTEETNLRVPWSNQNTPVLNHVEHKDGIFFALESFL